MYRTLFIALASSSVLCSAADAQVAGSVTGRVNATVGQTGIPVDPRTGQPLSRIEIMRAERAARLARRNAGELAADSDLLAAGGLTGEAQLEGEAPQFAGVVDTAQAPLDAAFEFDGLPAPAPVEVRALAQIPQPDIRVTAPQPAVSAAIPSAAPRPVVVSPSPRPGLESRDVVYRERTERVVRREPAPSGAPVATVRTAQPVAQPQIRAEAVTRTPRSGDGIPQWIVLLLAALTITGVVLAARRGARPTCRFQPD